MYGGLHNASVQVIDSGRLESPQPIVQWFESFEATDGSPVNTLGAWELVSVYEGCGNRRMSNATGLLEGDVCAAPGQNTPTASMDTGSSEATSDTFEIVCADAALLGNCALLADSVAHDGGAVKLQLGDQLPASATAMLRGYLRDECGYPDGSHWMSPNFQACQDGQDVRSTSTCAAHLPSL